MGARIKIVSIEKDSTVAILVHFFVQFDDIIRQKRDKNNCSVQVFKHLT